MGLCEDANQSVVAEHSVCGGTLSLLWPGTGFRPIKLQIKIVHDSHQIIFTSGSFAASS